MAVIEKRRTSPDPKTGKTQIKYRVKDRTQGFPSVSKSFSTLAHARTYCRKVEVERQGKAAGISRGRQRLQEAIDTFLATDNFRRRRSGADTRRHLDWWRDQLGNLPLSDIQPEVIADHLARYEAGGRSGATCNRLRAALSALYQYAIRERGWLTFNPCRAVGRKREGDGRQRVIRPNEWAALMKAARQGATPKGRGTALPEYLTVLYGTAARRSEVRHLTWADVDLEAGRITFPRTKNGTSRAVPAEGEVLAALKTQTTRKRDGSQYVFPSRFYRDRPEEFDKPFRAARAAAGLDTPDVHGEILVLHTLRHSAATEAGRAGATAFEIAALTGHKTLAMVSRYVKTGEDNARAALAKRAKLMAKPKGQVVSIRQVGK